jgi:hypothetical protein
MLTTYERLFLLALDEERGNFPPFVKKTLSHALSGGILAELSLLGKVRCNEKHRLELVDDTLTDDEILNEAIKDIQSSEKPRKLAYWVSQLSQRPKKLRERIGDRLVAKGMLYLEDRHYFWRLPSGEDEVVTAPAKFEMKRPLRTAILSTGEFDRQGMALLNVASAAGLLNLIFTQDELQIAQQCIHEKLVRVAMEDPIMQTIEEIEQAICTSLEDDID